MMNELLDEISEVLKEQFFIVLLLFLIKYINNNLTLAQDKTVMRDWRETSPFYEWIEQTKSKLILKVMGKLIEMILFTIFSRPV